MRQLTEDGFEPQVGSVTGTILIITTTPVKSVPEMTDPANLWLVPLHVAVMQETGLALSIIARSEVREVADINAFRNPPATSVFRLTGSKRTRRVCLSSATVFLMMDCSRMTRRWPTLSMFLRCEPDNEPEHCPEKVQNVEAFGPGILAQGLSPQEAFLHAYFAEGKRIYDFLAPVHGEFDPMAQVSVEGSALAVPKRN